MIDINLFPHREQAKLERKKQFNSSLLGAALLGLLAVALSYLWLQNKLAAQQNRNQLLSAEIAKLDVQIKEVNDLKKQIEDLNLRRQSVEDLQAQRNVPVHLMNELVSLLPDGVFLKKIDQTGLLIQLEGVAQTNERVSQYLNTIADRSQRFDTPELVEVVAGTTALNPRDVRRTSSFKVQMRIKPLATNSTTSPQETPATPSAPGVQP